jgi:redox-sensitive bicupin YhaK (pirin superfamily)
MTEQNLIRSATALGPGPWPTIDPFLFCVHHNDAYPAGTSDQGLAPQNLQGRDLGQDFSGKDGFSLYHGHPVPGFPAHPHRGFETVTVTRAGLIDHSDSMGATARYGDGDVQWLTAGAGIQHCEMFPLRHMDRANPAELFQIWLNLDARFKMATPYFSMFWAEEVPTAKHTDAQGKTTEVLCVAGSLGSTHALPPPPESWASRAGSDVAIYTVRMPAGAQWSLPAAHGATTRRMLYFFAGAQLHIGQQSADRHCAVELDAAQDCPLHAGHTGCELLILQGRPIGEPVAQHGPFVMNTRTEIEQAFADYHRTEFGGWPWGRPDPVHPAAQGRFALRPDGSTETPMAATPHIR